MGKNYIESSLKRFLKRKVKITLGLMVTFMISGALGYAEETVEKPDMSIEDYYEYTKYDETFIAEENLKGLGEGKISIEGTAIDWAKNNIEITEEKDTEGKTKTVIKYKNGDTMATAVEIDNSLISTKTAETVSETLKNMTGNDTTATDGINRGVLTTNQKLENKKGTICNYGIIASSEEMGQKISGNMSAGSVGSNYGIIINTGNKGQSIGIEGTIYNYGVIANGGDSGQTINGAGVIGNNYGIIANVLNNGQEILKGIGNNYGVIINGGGSGQLTNVGEDTIANNYGIIANKGDYGQRAINGEIYNYGIIKNKKSYGQFLRTTGKGAYNYGLIANEGEWAIGNEEKGTGKAVNYGVVKNSTGNVFNGIVDNYGIVILTNLPLQKDGLGKGADKGILLDKDYNILREDTKVFKAGETIQSFGKENSFGENISKGYVKNQSVNIDNTQGKVIGAVVTEELDKAVLNYNGEELFLKDTILTGYFEKNGTLLDVGNGKLTLGGDTHITAVKNDLSLDVYAVDISKGGQLTIIGDKAKINGKINIATGAEIAFKDAKDTFNITGGGDVAIGISESEAGDSKYQNYFNITLTSSSTDKEGDLITDATVGEIKISTENAVKGLKNTLVIDGSVKVGANDDGYSIYDTNTTNKDAELEITVNNIHNITGNVLLGAGKDTFIVSNNDNHTDEHMSTEINLGDGEDSFVVIGRAEKNIFSYNVVNAETIELREGTWGDWNDAEGKISFTSTGKTTTKPNIVLGNGTTMEITFDKDGSDFGNYIGTTLGLDHAVVTGTGNGSAVKYKIGNEGLDFSKLSSGKYSFGDGVEYKNESPLFNVESIKGKETVVTLKTAEDLGFSGQSKIIYDAYMKQIEADGKVDPTIITQLNNLTTEEGLKNLINGTAVAGEAYYTAGTTLTKDIANTYLSTVEDFKKRAGKGEWLAQGKYISSDTEFDGGAKVKGYDGDITGTVGMIEYGVTENTSYGVVFGQGDTEMDIQGGGSLEGDNRYLGAYMKHRTQDGIDLVANLGYVKSELDSLLRNDFNFNNSTVSGTGTAFEKGTADSSAVVVSLKGKKDYRISDSVKLMPTLGVRTTFINQEEASNPEMHFTISEQDIIVVEGIVGMGIGKEFSFEKGNLEINTGIEYTFAATNSNNDAKYKLFEDTDEKPIENDLEDSDTAENTGTFYLGADYEHENGVGFNGKYEILWSDKGDDSRFTAGISYRF